MLGGPDARRPPAGEVLRGVSARNVKSQDLTLLAACNEARGIWYATITVVKPGATTLSVIQSGDDTHAAASVARKALVLR